ncbi:hypothetical protein BDV18DRAFT_153622 [Aspergillus unguis]
MPQEPLHDYDTQSLTASVTDYPVMNGRTYHRYHEGSYSFPNDEAELNRLDMQHHMCKLMMKGHLFFAPLTNPRKILDLGTGSGIWPIELAPVFPDAEITGTDLSPCQPNEVPRNVQFIVDDITEDEWLYGHNSLDYIHSGHLSGSLPSFKDLLKKMYSHLKPGGWAEIHEFDTMVRCDDGTMPPLNEDGSLCKYPLLDWCDLQVTWGLETEPKRIFRIAHRLARGMRENGFVDVQEHIFKAPVNPWPTDAHHQNIGSWMEDNILEGLSGWSYKPFSENSRWSKAEYEVFLASVRNCVRDRNVHAYFNFHVIIGRKPHPGEQSTSTFRRFVNSQQRRYESRVPGPLEARRRLAKRRNTALASVAGMGPMDDIACLLGRNGREHMKWTNPGGLDYQFSPPIGAPPPAPAPASFYTENTNALEFENPLQNQSRPRVPERSKKHAQGQFFTKHLREYRTTSALKDAVRELGIDLRQEPSHSRVLFTHLLSLLGRGETTEIELVLFLDDPHLNIPGAMNYPEVVKHYVAQKAYFRPRNALFSAIVRALELGKLASEEIGAIIKALSRWSWTGGHPLEQEKHLMMVYRQLWDAIGNCAIYGHRDLDQSIVDDWLSILLERDARHGIAMAKDIMLATEDSHAAVSSRLSKYLIKWLHEPGTKKADVVEALKSFEAAVISTTILRVTEQLCSVTRTMPEHRYLFRKWGKCLADLHDVPNINLSKAWVEIRSHHDDKSHLPRPLLRRNLIIQRLWILYTINKDISTSACDMAGSSSANPSIRKLLQMYDFQRNDARKRDLWSSLTLGIYNLKLPFNLPAMAKDLSLSLTPSKSTANTQALERYKFSPIALPGTFSNTHHFNASAPIFFQNFDKMIRQIDIASPEFRAQALETARTSDTNNIWTLLRLFRSHTPLKIALSRAWPILDPSPKDKALVRYYATPRTSSEPDPHTALDMIHSVAIALACSEQISPRRAFQLVRWLYLFLYRHGAPIQPPLVRALYHAGVVRFRTGGSRVADEQMRYVMAIVERVEKRGFM